MLAGAMNPAHPGFMGHMDPMPATASVLGDLLAAAANNNMLSREMSPVFSQLEERLCEEAAHRFGLGQKSGGVMTSGGSLANVHALAAARNAAFPDAAENGLGGKRPVLFASEAAHTSVRKAAMLLGLGASAAVAVEADEDARLNPVALARQVEEATNAGRAPFCVVATAGTTTTGSVDPLPAIAEVAERYGLWLHVDAAYGGALIFSGEHRHRLGGIERADSVTFNPQKWCYVAKTCAMALFRDLKQMTGTFRVAAPYMREHAAVNLGEISVQGTRHADALKLWLTLGHLGRSGLEQLIEESYRLTAHLATEIRARPFLELAACPEMNLVCFRVVLDGCSPAEADPWNAGLQAFLLKEADVFLSLPLSFAAALARATLAASRAPEPFHRNRTHRPARRAHRRLRCPGGSLEGVLRVVASTTTAPTAPRSTAPRL